MLLPSSGYGMALNIFKFAVVIQECTYIVFVDVEVMILSRPLLYIETGSNFRGYNTEAMLPKLRLSWKKPNIRGVIIAISPEVLCKSKYLYHVMICLVANCQVRV